jgi:RecB family exonuclease
MSHKPYTVTESNESESARFGTLYFVRYADRFRAYGPFTDRQTAEDIATHQNDMYEKYRDVDLNALFAEVPLAEDFASVKESVSIANFKREHDRIANLAK